jgi:cholesterol oxidase
MTTRLARPLSSLAPRYDAVVVGSGYGGGVAAARLARAGVKVAVLERGREFVTGEFPSRFPELRQELQVTAKRVRTGKPTALYDVRVGDDMHVLVGCGLGGGSLVNAGVTLRPDARVFADPVWPGQLRQDGLIDEGYRRAARWLRPSSDPAATTRQKYRAFDAASRAVGKAPIAPTLAVSFEANVNPAGVAQPACTGCGDCCGGCNVGAKNTVALTYLPEAARHGAEIFTHAEVRHVTRIATGWRVVIDRHDEAGTLTVEADRVILAAGTLGSTEILLRSRAAGLAVSPALGHRFSANGDIIAFGYGAKEPIHAVGVGHPSKVADHVVGASVSGQIELDGDGELDRAMIIQEGAVPSAVAPVLPVMFVPNGRLLGALQSLVSGVYKGPFAHLQTFFAVSHDSASGRLGLDGDRLALSWPHAKDEPVFARLDAAIGALVRQAGGSYVKNPLAGTVMGHQPATAHPLGGAVMGATRATGVVNHRSEVFDGAAGAGETAVLPGLYVIDGAIIPRSLGCNPLFTITALAERAMIHMLRDMGRADDDADARRESAVA